MKTVANMDQSELAQLIAEIGYADVPLWAFEKVKSCRDTEAHRKLVFLIN